ncbi:MAG: hypothetical protein CVV64_16255 [Candidatus Wallbacteria bacterium HGW-Wallbacteria-1]|jgi:superfamily II DNA or RNA helicase|uniref:Helicase n=1 Tax=Candidatus Wallbacteria bacterium HGW-Wallbacteria-1 TaxID=2013854 RepID=A0A2N1PL17_9BACT|nr:MAG: hypothetical protein CVV64_16255 [Candidatus Wallbacteria bacterium HGW-Wallbacteria-1]
MKKFFTNKYKLQYQQLKILKWYDQWSENQSSNPDTITPVKNVSQGSLAIPDKWNLTGDIQPYFWQNDAYQKWIKNGNKGTVKVVTGAGKTFFALGLIEKFQCLQNDLHVAIVVPTIVLMNQWFEEITAHGNILETNVGRLGGGYHDGFENNVRILITVLASASDKLADTVNAGDVGNSLLLIVDESHRAGADKRSSIFDTPRIASLGLSATPEREDSDQQGNQKYDESHLGRELGKIIHELTYADALALNIIPPFTIEHYGILMSLKERGTYDSLTRYIRNLKKELEYCAPRNMDFWVWIRKESKKDKGNSAAQKLEKNLSKRKGLLYSLPGRSKALKALIDNELSVNRDAKILVFHETINDIMALYFDLVNSKKYPVVVEHSSLPDSIRQQNLELFRTGAAQILLSVKSLIEGFNVPEVDLGIIVASSSSVRQRIQSMGRVMRKHHKQKQAENNSVIQILYARDTIDETIYGKLEWDKILGAGANKYYHWDDISKPPINVDNPPKRPMPEDTDINLSDLSEDALYSGKYDGIEFSCDTTGTVTNDEGQMVDFPKELTEKILTIKGAGRFKVTRNRFYCLVHLNEINTWITKFVGVLNHLPGPIEEPEETVSEDWVNNPDNIGQPYPATILEIQAKYKFSQKRGGEIVKKVPSGEVYARGLERADDPAKGENADTLLKNIKRIHGTGKKINKLIVTLQGHVLSKYEGKYIYIGNLTAGLEFPR